MKSSLSEIKCVKVIALGLTGAGKTSILLKATNPDITPPTDVKCTIAVDIKIKKCIYKNMIPVNMHIWDTAGQDKFQQINRMYYRDVHATLIVFDVTNRKSFERIEFFCKDFEEFSHTESPVVKVLVGNKCDIKEREVSQAEGEAWAHAHSVPYFETSAKTGENITELFDYLLQKTVSCTTRSRAGSITLQATVSNAKKRRCC